MNKEYWNSDKMCYSNSDEFKYLDEIDDIINQAYNVVKGLKEIQSAAHWRIQCNDKKNIIDFSEVKNKLKEIQNWIDEG